MKSTKKYKKLTNWRAHSARLLCASRAQYLISRPGANQYSARARRAIKSNAVGVATMARGRRSHQTIRSPRAAPRGGQPRQGGAFGGDRIGRNHSAGFDRVILFCASIQSGSGRRSAPRLATPEQRRAASRTRTPLPVWPAFRSRRSGADFATCTKSRANSAEGGGGRGAARFLCARSRIRRMYIYSPLPPICRKCRTTQGPNHFGPGMARYSARA